MDKNEEIIKTAHRRYATKKFDADKKISDKDWDTIMEVGRLSPSAFGFSPWQFLLIESEEVKKDIYEDAWGAQNSLNGASHFLIILAKKGITATSKYVQYITEDVSGHHFAPDSPFSKKFDDFQKTQFDLTDDRKQFDWACKQTYIALANMMTAAAELGIDSCAIEGFDRSKIEDILTQKGILDPKEWGVSVMAGFGYRDQDITPKKRQPMDEVYRVIK
ncbi:NAD(P)H-dependent oxidoreductase [Apilactobacillus kunkeei]|uniref:NAD(P)H-dependent oxidoreductase n=1 Tax=Apilactobacillus kunkeei TaxID=148814 RepID=UPI0006B259A0|nr:NAD(P)H-dependent oxidoreductase [Apilactobacillus kunkeei]KOY68634.1 Oxygen-insensitive NAD(P)H nitroreductase / Dihydropteridine reductase [Apilactobacillus kunkeei]CAI2695435.1 Putative NAD(P)H nitroreductase [Apilactobacillus kunkeei]